MQQETKQALHRRALNLKVAKKHNRRAKNILGEGTESVHTNRHKITLSATVLKPQDNYL